MTLIPPGPPTALERIDGYEVTGPRTVLSKEWGVFVQRSTMSGRPWLKFSKKMTSAGYYVTAHKTKREATKQW